MYDLVHEYYHQAWLPPPLNILCHLANLAIYLLTWPQRWCHDYKRWVTIATYTALYSALSVILAISWGLYISMFPLTPCVLQWETREEYTEEVTSHYPVRCRVRARIQRRLYRAPGGWGDERRYVLLSVVERDSTNSQGGDQHTLLWVVHTPSSYLDRQCALKSDNTV